MEPDPSAVALFIAGAHRAIELFPGDVPRLQRLFELNPDYFLAVTGQPPSPHEAHDEVHEALPGCPFTKRRIVGFVDEQGSLAALASMVGSKPMRFRPGVTIAGSPAR